MSDQHEATYGPKQTTIKPWAKTDWCIKILADDKSELLAILANGTVRGSIEDAGPAAHRFVAELRGLTEAIRTEAKAEALREAVSDFESHIGVGEFAELSQRGSMPWGHLQDAWEHQGPYMDWLRTRADNLEKS